jgi:hypothetical protein
MTAINAALEAWGLAREKAEAASELERQIVRRLFLGALVVAQLPLHELRLIRR